MTRPKRKLALIPTATWFVHHVSMPNALDEASEILAKHRFCILATSGSDGRPWVTPLFYNHDAAFVFFWESARDARHTRVIAENPNVAIVVSDMAGVRGVYFESVAAEVPPALMDHALEVFLHGPHRRDRAGRTAADYAPGRPLGLYYARPVAAYLMTDAKDVDGYLLDERVPIPLPSQDSP
jgi:hypothetical protein